jgi:lysophospholipase L1-like esterase
MRIRHSAIVAFGAYLAGSLLWSSVACARPGADTHQASPSVAEEPGKPAEQPGKPVQQPSKPASPAHSAVTPNERTDDYSKQRVSEINARTRRGAVDGDIGVIFLGDSITDAWTSDDAGKAAWDEHFAPLNAVNYGISADRTQHVLFRLQHGNLEGLASPAKGAAPKLVVLMIGTNNSNGNDNSAEEIADGIVAVVHELRRQLPKTKVLMLAVFPRGEKPAPENAQRAKNAKASELASRVADGKDVRFLDIGSKFLQPDGTLSKEIMPDLLHLSPKGYKIWAESILPTVTDMLK